MSHYTELGINQSSFVLWFCYDFVQGLTLQFLCSEQVICSSHKLSKIVTRARHLNWDYDIKTSEHGNKRAKRERLLYTQRTKDLCSLGERKWHVLLSLSWLARASQTHGPSPVPSARSDTLSRAHAFQGSTKYPFSWDSCLQVQISENQPFSSVNQCEPAGQGLHFTPGAFPTFGKKTCKNSGLKIFLCMFFYKMPNPGSSELSTVSKTVNCFLIKKSIEI